MAVVVGAVPAAGEILDVGRTQKEHRMRDIGHALITAAMIALAVLTASAANAQYGPGPRGAYGYYGGYFPYAGTYYSYGADRANPSLSPNGWNSSNPRDFQLQ